MHATISEKELPSFCDLRSLCALYSILNKLFSPVKKKKNQNFNSISLTNFDTILNSQNKCKFITCVLLQTANKTALAPNTSYKPKALSIAYKNSLYRYTHIEFTKNIAIVASKY